MSETTRLEHEIEQTRADLAATVDALAAKVEATEQRLKTPLVVAAGLAAGAVVGLVVQHFRR
jgi:F0F1-type ATP synthase assembly protein I